MKILVCITHVPDTTSKISFTPDGKKFDATGVQYIIGPYDDYALSKAVDLKTQAGEGEITVLNVGTGTSDASLRKALAIGADKAVRIDAEPADSFFVARQIADYAQGKDFDLVMMGRESIDFNGGVVHGMVGEMLSVPSIAPVMLLEIEGGKAKIEREIDAGTENLEAELPLVLGCQEPIAEWKIPNMRGIMSAKRKPFEVIPAGNGAEKTEAEKYVLPEKKDAVRMVDAENMEELVDLLRNEAKVL
ncbi:electron transfer flavoprotein subunit alpha [Fulvitalea axinellae]|uniref:Electron transfer flavoprotein subunit beta n=1 Tax=Fulvitalea axinellae TaxID=1182444 RepID=A0AAU9CGG9_9BACT|nr:electron transfer flavoprotein subunit alpha [Fulvitalea axinellae]